MGRMWRWVSAVMFVLFVSWAAFQYNDPDALAWAAVYGLAALCSALFFFGRLPALLAAAVSGAGLLWALFLVPEAISRDWSLFLDEVEGEPLREMSGLLIVAAWTGFLAWQARRRVRTAAPSRTA